MGLTMSAYLCVHVLAYVHVCVWKRNREIIVLAWDRILLPAGCTRAIPGILFWPWWSCYVLVTCHPRFEVWRTKRPRRQPTRSFLSLATVATAPTHEYPEWHRFIYFLERRSAHWVVKDFCTHAFCVLFCYLPLCASVNSYHGIVNVAQCVLLHWLNLPISPTLLHVLRFPWTHWIVLLK